MVDHLLAFDQLGLQRTPASFLARMGIAVPTPIQADAIPALLQGRDVVGQARTGSGKTLAFALPIVDRCSAAVREVQALVLVPTRELAIQVAGVIAELGDRHQLRVTLLYGGRSSLPERQALKLGAHVIVGTPGRTLDHLREGSLDLGRLRILVLDEADEMLDRGFAPDVERIIARVPAVRQTALFSATIPDWVTTTAAKHLRNPVTVRVDIELEAPPEIEHVVYETEAAARFDVLTGLLDRRPDTSVLVFGRTKHGVKKLARQLVQMGYPVAALQGNLSQRARERALADFRSGEVRILCATNVAARGLDVESIGQVINYELPESAELFTHRVGRTGRMGRKGEAITLVTPEDGPKLLEIERKLGRRLPRHGAPVMPALPIRGAPLVAAKRPIVDSPGSRPPGGLTERLARRRRRRPHPWVVGAPMPSLDGGPRLRLTR